MCLSRKICVRIWVVRNFYFNNALPILLDMAEYRRRLYLFTQNDVLTVVGNCLKDNTL